MFLQSFLFLESFGDAVVQYFGGETKGDLTNAANSLDNIHPYLHFVDPVGQIFNSFGWGIIKMLYGIAKWAQDLVTESFTFKDLLKSAGVSDMAQSYVLGASAAVLIAVMVWVGIKYMFGKNKSKVSNIILQAMIAVFLMFNIQTLTNWAVEQSTGFYQDVTTSGISQKVDGKSVKGSSNIAFDVIKGSSNDLMWMFYSNWKGYSTKDSGKIQNQYKEHYGNNSWTEKSFEELSPSSLSLAITPDTAEAMQKSMEKTYKPNQMKVQPKYLQYHFIDGGTNSDGSPAKTVVKIDKKSIPFFSAWSGGYQRYSVAFFPVVISLLALTIAYFFITWMVIKCFLDLAIMQVLSVLIFSTDIESGEKTKQAVSDIFTSAITIAFQGIELAFYRIVILWMLNKGLDPWLYSIGMIVATVMLFSGSQKVAKFFGVDTGAQHGFGMAAMTVNQALGAGKKLAGVGAAGVGMAVGGLKAVKSVGKPNINKQARTLNKAAKDSALKDGYSEDEARKIGKNAANSLKNQYKDFKAAGGSDRAWRTATSGSDGLVKGMLNKGKITSDSPMASAAKNEAKRMFGNKGLTDKEMNAIHREPSTTAFNPSSMVATPSKSTHDVPNKGASNSNMNNRTEGTNPTASNLQSVLKSNNSSDRKINDGLKTNNLDASNKNSSSSLNASTTKAPSSERTINTQGGDEKVKINQSAGRSIKDITHSATTGSELINHAKNNLSNPVDKVGQGQSTTKNVTGQGSTDKVNVMRNGKISENVRTNPTATKVVSQDSAGSVMPNVTSNSQSQPRTTSVTGQGDTNQVNVMRNGKVSENVRTNPTATKVVSQDSAGTAMPNVTSNSQSQSRTTNVTGQGDTNQVNVMRNGKVSENISTNPTATKVVSQGNAGSEMSNITSNLQDTTTTKNVTAQGDTNRVNVVKNNKIDKNIKTKRQVDKKVWRKKR
ncbi:hypothetical protein LZE20_04070 [Lactobacillus jensenii]|uniref:pLS20_p028 family conjugation system transmembrane protein n=1 Tax=Lactobacillus jensenii TaxID=109790 RepID=UPI001192E2CF|nr:hypothetical protein [Lactobacillus jensenii]MCF1843093.1 hypothetical protein [Lactobacillus jensenii]TVV04986.1 hypothetical protein FOF79_03420 [Lactobacillus jensenii]